MQSDNYRVFEISPLVPVCISLIAGIVIGFTFFDDLSLPLLVASGSALFLLNIFLFSHRFIQTAVLLLMIALFGVVVSVLKVRQTTDSLPETMCRFEGVVMSEPVSRGKTVRADVLLVDGELCGHSIRASFLKDSVAQSHLLLKPGLGVVFDARLSEPADFGDGKFNYARYLRSHGILATAFIPPSRWESEALPLDNMSTVDKLRFVALRFRHGLAERLKAAGLQGDDYAVAAAMALGEKSSLSADVRDVYSVAGASHVLALSGLHLGIIFSLLSIFAVGYSRSLLFQVILVLSVWAFVFVVGLSPSVVRAAIMISVYSVVGLTGRVPMSLNTLAFAAILMLVANPYNLYDVGFQMSFAAVAFILLYHRQLLSVVSWRYQATHRRFRWFWGMTVVSCLAQLGTAPLVAYYFGRLPVLALLAGYIVVPVTILILYLAIAVVVPVVPVVTQVLSACLSFVVAALNGLLAWLAGLPQASIDGISLGYMQVFFIYVAIFSFMGIVVILRRVYLPSRGFLE